MQFDFDFVLVCLSVYTFTMPYVPKWMTELIEKGQGLFRSVASEAGGNERERGRERDEREAVRGEKEAEQEFEKIG